MLKRNGENCEHPVPNYPGLLTAGELKAYQVIPPEFADMFVRLLSRFTTNKIRFRTKIFKAPESPRIRH